MPVPITVTVNEKKLQKALDDLADKGKLKPAMEAIGRAIKSRVQMGFRSGVSPYGDKWLPLKMRDGQPLRDTGRLQRSITYVAGADSVAIGTNLTSQHHGRTYVWPRVHQYGAHIYPRWAPALRFMNKKTGKLVVSQGVYVPPRPFLPINASGQLELPESWGKKVLDILGAAISGGKVAE